MIYNVFIAEDEYLIRNNLRKEIVALSEKYPINFIGEAPDGEMALASILELQPDIIITDIRMPFMDGITFAKEARKLLPWARIIFISGFDDFEYMKAAIQIQADEYLMKPIKEYELEKTIEQAIQHLDEQKQSTSKQQDDSEIFMMEVKKNHFLNGLFEGIYPIADAISEAESLNIKIAGKKYTVLLATNTFKHKFNDYTHFSEYLYFLFNDHTQIIYSSVSSRYIKFLIFDTNKEKVLETSYQVAHTLIHEFEQNNQDDIAVSIGPVVNRLLEIPESFKKAEDMLESYGKLRTEKIISFEDDMKEGELSPTHPFKMDLAAEISKLTKESVPKLIATLTEKKGTWERTRMIRFFILTELNSLLKKKQLQMEEFLAEDKQQNDLIELSSDNESYSQLIHDILYYLIEHNVHPSMTKYQSVINHALSFIDANFTSPDMSLTMVAEELEMSPAHFSTIFSQSMEKTFIDYLTEQRINLAKMLLTDTNQKLTEIALSVGYNDSNYFSFLFKKRLGISPTTYRKRNA